MRLLPVVMVMAGVMGVRAGGVNRSAMAELRSKLLSRADPFLLPSDGSEPVDVSITFKTQSIVDVDTAEEAMTVVLALFIRWQDTNFAWQDEGYKDIKRVVIPSSLVWTPRLMIANSLDPFALLTQDKEVLVGSSGQMTIQVLNMYRLKCKLEMDRYPYDTQKCRVDVENLYGYSTNISASAKSIKVNYGEWNFVDEDVTVEPEYRTSVIYYTIYIQRINAFYSIQVVFPMTLMSVLHALVFLVPAETGEKCSYLMSVFVSHFMFQNLIYTSLPRSSVSRLSVFSVLILVQGVAAILATVLSLHRHHQASCSPDPRQGQGPQVKDTIKVHPVEKVEGEGVGRPAWEAPKKCLHWSDYALSAVFLVISIACPVVLFYS